MQHAMNYLKSIAQRSENHRLYLWMTSSEHEDPRRHYDNFILPLGMIMTFPVYNDQYLRYRRADGGRDCPETRYPGLTQAINDQVAEDKTHARLFLHDARKIGLAKVWGMERPSTVLWSLFVSPMLDKFRASLGRRVKAVVNDTNEYPPFRYLQMEELESWGNQVFIASAKKATEIEQDVGTRLLYFGDYHLERESGHVGGKEFAKVELNRDEAAHARTLMDDMHEVSDELTTEMYGFASRAQGAKSAGELFMAEQQQHLAHVRTRLRHYQAGEIPEPSWSLAPKSVSGSRGGPEGTVDQSAIFEAWQHHHASFANHRFTDLFASAEGREVGFALRCASLVFAVRICSLHDFYQNDCELPADTKAPGADAVRLFATTFATEAETVFHDWDVLGMDERIPWDMADMLEWWFLDHRYGRREIETLFALRRWALRQDNDPIIKYWAMMAVHMGSRAFFAAANPLTKRFAANNPELPPLTYLSGVHHLLYPAGSADPGHPTSVADLPVTEKQRDFILKMLEVFAKDGLQQFDNLARALTTDRARFEFLL